MKDIEIVKIDYSAADPAYKVKEKHVIKDISVPWLVPDQGPYYTTGLRLYNAGTPLTYEKDYIYDTPASELTDRLGRDVYHFIILRDHIVSSATAIDIEYQKVGNPMLGRNQLLQMLDDLIISGKPIDITTSVIGMPETFPSAKHSMDVTKPEEVVGFGNLMMLFSILSGRVAGNGDYVKELLDKLKTDNFKRLDYIQNLQWNAIINHTSRVRNPHGVKADNVELGKLENYKTATPAQEIEGTRSDLYSTPHGLGEIIRETEPDSEEFVFQNELPFSYYGSGLYLPPPISGSFEGLGADIENGTFVQEGNGWVVGLSRMFDGRLRNLYYIYDQGLDDIPNVGNFRNSYVQYRHPTIDAAGCSATMTMSGSGADVLVVGDQEKNRYWITDPNSTLDPTAHVFKEMDLSVYSNRKDWQYWVNASSNIFKVGGYFYLMVYNDENIEGIDSTGYVLANAAGWLCRCPVADLTNPNKPTMVFQAVNLTYDNLRRERRVNQSAFSIDRWERNANGFTSGLGCRFGSNTVELMSHRRRAMIFCPNPNNENVIAVKILFIVRTVRRTQFGNVARQVTMAVDYTFDATTNTLALSPKWKYVTLDEANEIPTNLDQESLNRQWLTAGMVAGNSGRKGIFTFGGTRINVSFIPGYGYIGQYSSADGGLPHAICKTLVNPSRDPSRDWEYFQQPTTYIMPNGESNDGTNGISYETPFGFMAYPVWNVDVFNINGVNSPTPVELFMGFSHDKAETFFYRECEPGDGTKYLQRPELKLLSGVTPYSRQMNSRYGIVKGMHSYMGRVNNPRSRDKYSAEYGCFSVHWNGVPAKPPRFTIVPGRNANPSAPVYGPDRGIYIPLICEHELANGVMTVRSTPAGSVYLPAYIWSEWKDRITNGELWPSIDMSVDFYLCAKKDGAPLGRRHSYAVFTYHTTDNPLDIKQVISKFTWDTNGQMPDGTPIMRVSSEQYPFTSGITGNPLKPKRDLAPGETNIHLPAASNDVTHQPNGQWSYIDPSALSRMSLQVLEYPELGPDQFTIWGYSGWRLSTVSYSRIFTFNDSNVPSHTANNIKAYSPWTGAYVGYGAFQIAHPDYDMCAGLNFNDVGGGAMNLVVANGGRQILMGSVFSVGNWSVFVNSDVTVTFNGYSMTAVKRNFDLRDFSEKYRDNVFYIYCVARGSKAEYELTHILRHSRGDCLLICKITTGSQGISLIERYQPFAINGSPMTPVRDAGIPYTTGNMFEDGEWNHIKKSELYID
ncbi:hypothetical protein D6_0118 [Aeromonas phage D6]|uniref:Uncharacterized protein n=1 Tax=Aeromonas phage D6 TaxID=2593322 RepID=A0A514TW69_9CAUD|nr:virion structural protein [Aeromonas phage D6]QDJ97278.1 hypothetical protein D6_0118 [Aeromonas phage D6]